MAWYLSPSGWPQFADDGSLYADRLAGLGWAPLSESQVQAAVDAYNARTPLAAPSVNYVTTSALVLSPTAPVSPAPGTVWINTAV